MYISYIIHINAFIHAYTHSHTHIHIHIHIQTYKHTNTRTHKTCACAGLDDKIGVRFRVLVRQIVSENLCCRPYMLLLPPAICHEVSFYISQQTDLTTMAMMFFALARLANALVEACERVKIFSSTRQKASWWSRGNSVCCFANPYYSTRANTHHFSQMLMVRLLMDTRDNFDAPPLFPLGPCSIAEQAQKLEVVNTRCDPLFGC